MYEVYWIAYHEMGAVALFLSESDAAEYATANDTHYKSIRQEDIHEYF